MQMQMLVMLIASWLSANHGLAPLTAAPQVKIVPIERLAEQRRQRVASAQRVPTTSVALPPPSTAPGVHAFYDDADRTIYLSDDWSAASPAHVSVLVHELVHHVQNLEGERYACPAAREQPAYRAQADWLELLGTNLEEAFQIDPMTLLLRTRCLPP